MQYVKKMAPQVCAVLKGMLFIGFSIQIVFGIFWICCNFGQVQEFGEPDSAWYGGLLKLFGGNPPVLYFVQLATALFTGILFLQRLRPAGAAFALWRGLALLTFPFALQCHLALQPYSLMGSLFLLMLLSLQSIDRKRGALFLTAALVCGVLMAAFSGVADTDRREAPGYSFEGALASRFAWPSLWNDFPGYGEDIVTAAGQVAWDASRYPDNMKLLQEALERQMGEEAARACYLRMTRMSWGWHKAAVLRQMSWDMLGYAATPVVFPLLMEGRGYDSYTGRNYEVMREQAPILTKRFVEYGCWWFVQAIILAVVLVVVRAFGDDRQKDTAGKRSGCSWRQVMSIGICVFTSGLLVMALTMRGAGRMDYRYTIAVNELWLIGALSSMGGKRRERI